MRADILMKRDEKSWTSAERLKAYEHPGRKHGKPHGSWVGDLADLRKVVLLCSECASKFDYKRHRYRREEEFRYVLGNCDACKVFDSYCSMYIAEETYVTVRSTADERRGLMKWREKQIRTKGYL